MSLDDVNTIPWPVPLTLDALGTAIGHMRDLVVVVSAIPPHLRDPRLSGLTVVDGDVAHVFYDPSLSELNRMQTILHEYAHILNRDVLPHTTFVHARSSAHSEIEREAELTAAHLLSEYIARERPPDDISRFFTGKRNRKRPST